MQTEEVSELLLILTKNAKLFICVYNPGANVGWLPRPVSAIFHLHIFLTLALSLNVDVTEASNCLYSKL